MRLLILFSFLCGIVACSAGKPGGDPAQLPDNQPTQILDSNGTEKGNGAEDHDYAENSAWFADRDREITYCVQVTPEFGVAQARVFEAVKTSFGRWHDYITTKQIHRKWKYGAMLGLAIKSKVLPICDGTEDVAFYFGAPNEQVKVDQTKHPRAWAYSQLLKYDLETHWGKGYVWFRNLGDLSQEEGKVWPNWQAPASLEMILTHEIGHIYGSGHIRGTIMASDIAYRARAEWLKHPEMRLKLLQIDQNNELVRAKGIENYEGILGAKATGKDYPRENFIFLFGREPVGNITAIVQASYVGDVKLQVSDSNETRSFSLLDTKQSDLGTAEQTNVFKINVDKNGLLMEIFSRNSVLKLITNSQGEQALVIVSRNVNSEINGSRWDDIDRLVSDRMQLRMLTKNSSRPLFLSTY